MFFTLSELDADCRGSLRSTRATLAPSEPSLLATDNPIPFLLRLLLQLDLQTAVLLLQFSFSRSVQVINHPGSSENYKLHSLAFPSSQCEQSAKGLAKLFPPMSKLLLKIDSSDRKVESMEQLRHQARTKPIGWIHLRVSFERNLEVKHAE